MGIFDIFSTDDQQAAAQAQENALRLGQTQAQSAITGGLNQATGSYTAGIAPFLSNLQTAQGGQTAYANATGVNGPAGNAQALQNFQASPGYQYQLQQATDNYLRNQASTGMLGSGNTAAGVTNLASNLANQGWQQYVQNLSPWIGASTQNAQGVQQGYNTLGGAQLATGNTLGSLAYGTNVGIGNAQASADLAGLNQSANILGAGMNLAKSAIGFL